MAPVCATTLAGKTTQTCPRLANAEYGIANRA
jgi:hypothetical protein